MAPTASPTHHSHQSCGTRSHSCTPETASVPTPMVALMMVLPAAATRTNVSTSRTR